jgi:hypothetical protein
MIACAIVVYCELIGITNKPVLNGITYISVIKGY